MNKMYKKLWIVTSFILAILFSLILSTRVEATSYVSQNKRSELLNSNYYYIIDYKDGEVNPWELNVVNEDRVVNYPSSSYLINAIDDHRRDSTTYEFHDCLIKFKSFVVKEDIWFTKGTYYVTAYDGDIFLKGKGENAEAYYDVASEGFSVYYGAVVYLYDCTIEAIETLTILSDATSGDVSELYLDNVQFNFASAVSEVDSMGNHEYVEPKEITIGSDGISNILNIVNGTKMDITEFTYCLKDTSTCTKGEKYPRGINGYGNFYIENSTLDYNDFYFNRIYGNVNFNSNVTLLGNDDEALPCILNYGRVYLSDEPIIKNWIDGTTNVNGAIFRIFNEISSSVVEVFGFDETSGTKFEIYANEYAYNYDKAILIKGDEISVSRFEAKLSFINQYINESDVDSLIAYSEVALNESYYVLQVRFNYYKIYLSSRWQTYEYYYVPVNSTIDNIYGGRTFEVSDFFPDEYADDFEFAGYEYCYHDTSSEKISCSDIEDMYVQKVDHWYSSFSVAINYKKYYITFDEESMLGSTKETYVTRAYVGDKIRVTIPDNRPSINEYVFKGWSLTKNGELLEDDYVFVTEENYKNITLYAVYNPVYTIEYWSLGTVVYSGVKESGTILAEPQYTPPAKDGYRFEYWYDKSDSTGAEYEFGQVITGYLSLEAKWTRLYKVTFAIEGDFEDLEWENDTDSIFSDNTETFIVEEDEIVENFIGDIVPVRIDYMIAGWYVSGSSSTTPYEFGNYPTKDIVLYPIWTIKTFTIKFHKPHNITDPIANWPADYTVEKYTKIYEPAEKMTTTDYTFQYWNYEVIPGTLALFYWGYEVKEDINIYPYFSANQYNINYVLETIDSINPALYDEGEFSSYVTADDKNTKINLPKEEDFAVLPENYKFVGWSRNKDASRSDASTTIAINGTEYRNLTLYPIWVVKHKVHFVAEEALGWEHEETFEMLPDNTTEYVVKVTDGDKVEPCKYVPYNWTHTFKYWGIKNSSGDIIPFDFETTIVEETHLYAAWEAIVVTITYKHTEGLDENATSWPSNFTINAGQNIDKPEDPTLYGYEFIGWYQNTHEFDFEDIIYDPLTLVAKWQIVEHDITYNMSMPDGSVASFNGDYISKLTINDIGTTITLPKVENVVMHEKYSFIGWRKTDSSDVITTLEITKDNYTNIELTLDVSLKSIEIIYLLVGEYYPGTMDVKWMLEVEDKWGIKNYLNGAVYDERQKIAVITLDSEDDYHTLPDVNDVFVTNNYRDVSHWTVDFKDVAPGFTINYDNAWDYIDSNGQIRVDPVFVENTYNVDFTNSAYDEEWEKDLNDDVYINASYDYGADSNGQSFFVFEVIDGNYTLVKRATIRNAIIPATTLGIGYHDLVAFWIAGTLENFEEIDSYEDLLGIEKYKFETYITIVKAKVELDETAIPSYIYDGTSKCITASILGVEGIEIDCESKIDSGEYTFTARLINKENSTWSDGSVEDRTYNWVIGRRVVYHNGDLTNDNMIEKYDSYQKGQTYEITIEDVVQQEILDDTSYEFTGTYISTNAGKFNFRVTFLKNYYFLVSDGSDTIEYTDFTWEVKKSYTIIKPNEPSQEKLIRQYKSDEKGTVLFSLSDFYPISQLNQISEYVEVTGDVSYTAMGTYYVRVTIKEKENYGWSPFISGFIPGGSHDVGIDGGYNPSLGGTTEAPSSDDIIFEWKVNPLYVPVPYIYVDGRSHHLTNSNTILFNSTMGIDLYYSESYKHELELVYSDDSYANYVEIVGNISGENAGEYSFTLKLKDKSTSSWHSGYMDYDGGIQTSDINVTWFILPQYTYSSVSIMIEEGKLVINTSGIRHEAVVTFVNDTIDPNMTPSTKLDLVVGENYIRYFIDYVSDNYYDEEGGFPFYYDGTPLEDEGDNPSTNPEDTPTTPPGDTPPSQNPSDKEEDSNESSKKSGSGCSIGKNTKSTGYGDLLAIIMVFGCVFFRRKFTI